MSSELPSTSVPTVNGLINEVSKVKLIFFFFSELRKPRAVLLDGMITADFQWDEW